MGVMYHLSRYKRQQQTNELFSLDLKAVNKVGSVFFLYISTQLYFSVTVYNAEAYIKRSVMCESHYWSNITAWSKSDTCMIQIRLYDSQTYVIV